MDTGFKIIFVQRNFFVCQRILSRGLYLVFQKCWSTGIAGLVEEPMNGDADLGHVVVRRNCGLWEA